jgi:hypothetical protein
MSQTLNPNHTVTLNLFQGPFCLSSSGLAARWMLKQVQHDGLLSWEVAE